MDWHSLHGMQWRQLVLQIVELACSTRPLDLLVLHLGGNVLPMISVAEMMDLLVEDLHILEMLTASHLA